MSKDKKDNNNKKEEAIMERTTIMEFPCEFVIKMMGKNNDEFRAAAKAVIAKHYPEASDKDFKEVPSKDETYVALSAKVTAKSQEELDTCYQDLTKEPLVLIAL